MWRRGGPGEGAEPIDPELNLEVVAIDGPRWLTWEAGRALPWKYSSPEPMVREKRHLLVCRFAPLARSRQQGHKTKSITLTK